MSENLKTKYFSDEDKIHALIAERDQIIQTLATERDKFGKRETELMARVERLEEALRQISLKRCDHDTSPCRSQNIAKEALREGTTYGEGKA